LWIGTAGGGLNRYNPETPNNWMKDEDEVWIRTNDEKEILIPKNFKWGLKEV